MKTFKQHIFEKLKISKTIRGLNQKDLEYICSGIYDFIKQEASWSYEDIESYFIEIEKLNSIFNFLVEAEYLDDVSYFIYNFDVHKENRFNFKREEDVDKFLKDYDIELTEYFLEIYA